MATRLPPPPPPPPTQPPPPPAPAPWQPPKASGWRDWSGRRKVIVGGAVALVILTVVGTLLGPKRPAAQPFPTPIAALPSTQPVPTTAAPSLTPRPTVTAANATPTAIVTLSLPTATPSIGKYTQTWRIPYGDTTCVHCKDEMDEHQRWVMAADMLLTLKRTDDPSVGLPPDFQVDLFKADIDTVCLNEGYTLVRPVIEVAAAIYVMADYLKP